MVASFKPRNSAQAGNTFMIEDFPVVTPMKYIVRWLAEPSPPLRSAVVAP